MTSTMPTGAGHHSGGMLDIMAGFIQELRSAGLPVSLTENLDAMEAIRQIPLEDREAFKYALAATLVKNNAHWKAFETIFEVYFSSRGRHHNIDGEEAQGDEADLERLLEELMGERTGQGGGAMEAMTPEELAEMLYKALLEGDQAMMRALSRQAVKRYAGMGAGLRDGHGRSPPEADVVI